MKTLRNTILSSAFGLSLALLTSGCLGLFGGSGGGGGGGGGADLGATGAACTTGEDCEEGLACHAGLPGGYCISQCWDACPDGSTCTYFAGQDWCMGDCAADGDCREGYICRNSVCQPPCVTDRDCADGLSCQNGSCVSGGIGAGCSSPADCAADLSCAPGLPGGYCTRSCETEACPTGTACTTYGGSSYCFDSCLSSSDCRSGYVCSAGVCDQACASDADCSGGELCINSACVGSGVGDPCQVGTDCQSPLGCYRGIPEGYCTEACTSGADCPAGSTCGNLRGSRMCVAVCRADADCGSGQRCFGGACVIPCTQDSECLDGYCDTSSGQCRSTTAGSGNTEVIDYGTITPGSTQSIPVDAQTFAFTISVVGVSGSNYAITSVRRPDGTQLVSNDLWTGQLRVSPGDQYGAITVPNADNSNLYMRPGTWTWQFQSDYGRTGRAYAFIKKSSTGQHVGGNIPMRLYLAPNAIPGVTASNAASNSHVQGAIDRFRHFYRDQADIDLSSIEYTDIAASYTDVTSGSEYTGMFAQYARDGELSVFWVRSLSVGGSSEVAGIAGGIPGPPRAGATLSSGVVVEVQDYSRLTGDDMAHEVGHFQGLYHVTETDGRTHDRLSDTPQCPDLYSCTAGYYQLMFPALTGYQDTLTPASVMAVQGNAVSD
ncbi:MAG: hypothetical protein P1V51_22635 [Deltaproteobacteria bacterium]|nr:hypothetical protein [Deltaproteobacteria bacterium]